MIETLIFFIFSVIIGLMFLFFGYVFFRILLPIWAFFAGLMFGVNGIESLMGSGFLSVSMGLVLGLIIGVVLACLAYFLYAFAVYIFGITLGYVLGSGLMMAIGMDQGFLTALVGIGGAILFAVIFAMAKMPRLFIVFLTAAAGAMAVIMGLMVLFGRIPDAAASLEITRYMVSGSWFWMIAWIVLGSFGAAFQYFSLKVAQDVSDEELNKPYVWEKEYVAL